MADLSPWITEIQAFMTKGGFVMWPLLLISMLLWYGLGFRFWILRRRVRGSVRQLVKRPFSAEAKPKGIISAAIREGQLIKLQAPTHLRRHLDTEFSPFQKELGKHGATIKIVILIAPLLGLLGTVSGMIETFDSMAEMALFSQSGGIAGGISQALFTTQMGLAVAIPGVLVKFVLDQKQRQIESELEQIKDLLCLDVLNT